MNQKDRERLVKEESARFIDDGFGQLDLQSYPDLAHPQTETFEADDKYGFNRIDTSGLSGVNQLRELIENPDRDALEQVARETGDPNLGQEIREQRQEAVAVEFRKRRPRYEPTADNFACLVSCLHWNLFKVEDNDTNKAVDALYDAGAWTPDNLVSAYDALLEAGQLDVPEGSSRRLTEDERLLVTRLAQSGQTEAAVERYLQAALDERHLDPEIVHDARYRALCDESVFFVFECSEIDYRPTAERRNFLIDFCAQRPMTLTMLRQAWQLCKRQEANAERGLILRSVGEEMNSAPDLDSLDDSSVDRLYHASLREWARSTKRPTAMCA